MNDIISRIRRMAEKNRKIVGVTLAQGFVFCLCLRLIIPTQYYTVALLLFAMCMPAVYWGFAVASNRGKISGAAVYQETAVLLAYGAIVAFAMIHARGMAALIVLIHGIYDLTHALGIMPHSSHVPGNYALVCATFDIAVASSHYGLAMLGW
jgi:hypothetical protein